MLIEYYKDLYARLVSMGEANCASGLVDIYEMQDLANKLVLLDGVIDSLEDYYGIDDVEETSDSVLEY